jgi:DNA-binding NarL/FixJ family response regulator
MPKINVFICEDHPDYREGLKIFLKTQGNINVVGDAANGKDALKLITKSEPDICLLDLSMPIMNGIELIQKISDQDLETKIIILSQHSTKDWVEQLFLYKIDGFLLKTDAKSCVTEAIMKVMSGEKYFTPSTGSIFYNILASEKDQISPRPNILSSREKEIARLTSKGHTVKEMANNLNCSENTVKTHKSNLMKKLKLKNSIEVATWYQENF